MNPQTIEPVVRLSFDATDLVSRLAPRWSHPNKEVVWRIASPPGAQHSGRPIFTRWPAMALPDVPDSAASRTTFEARPDVFGYEALLGGGTVEWYLNFANYDLFSAYGSALFAQDEMQVAEHPALGSLRQALPAANVRPLTVEGGQPTFRLVSGVARRCAIATEPDAGQGRRHRRARRTRESGPG